MSLVPEWNDEPILREWVRASAIKTGLARRARIVLLAADGLPNTRIAELTGSSVVTVLKWRTRYVEADIAGLGDGLAKLVTRSLTTGASPRPLRTPTPRPTEYRRHSARACKVNAPLWRSKNEIEPVRLG